MLPSNIELSSGSLYFKGMAEPLEVSDIEVTDESEWYDDNKPYIRFNQEPIEITLDNIERPRDWVLAECKECGYNFPISEWYSLLMGTKGWTCPRCTFNKRLEEARRRI